MVCLGVCVCVCDSKFSHWIDQSTNTSPLKSQTTNRDIDLPTQIYLFIGDVFIHHLRIYLIFSQIMLAPPKWMLWFVCGPFINREAFVSMKMDGVRFLANVWLKKLFQNKTFHNPMFSTNKIKWWISIKVKSTIMQIELDHQSEEFVDWTRIELFQFAMVNMSISNLNLKNRLWCSVLIFTQCNWKKVIKYQNTQLILNTKLVSFISYLWFRSKCVYNIHRNLILTRWFIARIWL